MWCDLGGPGWSRSMPFQAGPCVSTHPPALGGADLPAEATPTRSFPPGTEGHLCSHHS